MSAAPIFMETATPTSGAPKNTSEVKFDAKAYLVLNLPRAKGQTIRAMSLGGGNFRVNWYERVETGLTGLETQRIARSRHVHCDEKSGIMESPRQ